MCIRDRIKNKTPISVVDENNQFVLFLKGSGDLQNDFVTATTKYVSECFLPNTKKVFDGRMRKACECRITNKILSNHTKFGAVEIFRNNELKKAFENDALLNEE